LPLCLLFCRAVSSLRVGVSLETGFTPFQQRRCNSGDGLPARACLSRFFLALVADMSVPPKSMSDGKIELKKVISMRFKVALAFGGQAVKEDILEIKEQKLGDLTDEEIERAIEINIRSWLDKHLQIELEVIEEE
jgi:hypothetical protein